MNLLEKIFNYPHYENSSHKEDSSRRNFLKNSLLIGGTISLFGDKVFALTESSENTDPALEPFQEFLERRRDELYKEGKKALEVNTTISNEAFEMYSEYINTKNTEGKKLLTTEYQLILLNHKKLLGLNNTLKQLHEGMDGKNADALKDYNEKRTRYSELYKKVSESFTPFKDKSDIQQKKLSKCLSNLKELDTFEKSVNLRPNHKTVSAQLHREGRETIMLYIAQCTNINKLKTTLLY